MAIVTPADRPKSVRNRCVIEVFGGVLCVVMLLFGFFCRCRGFCHGLSQISSFSLDVKSLLLHRVNSYSTQLICIPNEIFIENKFCFTVRLLYFVGIRSVLKLKYEC